MLISINKRFIFIANSKTGSTTIESILKPCADFVWEGSPKIKHASWVEVKNAFYLLFEHPTYAPERFMRFGVVREPADWVLSWYNYRRFRNNAGIPKDMPFEAFWRSGDWVKRTSQAAKFHDEDGQCRFNLIIPMIRLRGALPRLFQAMGVATASAEEMKNKSKGTLRKENISSELWNEINDHYRTDWLMYKDWEDRFDAEFPRVLERFYGENAQPLLELPAMFRVMPEKPVAKLMKKQ